jgi:hypothetical protein
MTRLGGCGLSAALRSLSELHNCNQIVVSREGVRKKQDKALGSVNELGILKFALL